MIEALYKYCFCLYNFDNYVSVTNFRQVILCVITLMIKTAKVDSKNIEKFGWLKYSSVVLVKEMYDLNCSPLVNKNYLNL